MGSVQESPYRNYNIHLRFLVDTVNVSLSRRIGGREYKYIKIFYIFQWLWYDMYRMTLYKEFFRGVILFYEQRPRKRADTVTNASEKRWHPARSATARVGH